MEGVVVRNIVCDYPAVRPSRAGLIRGIGRAKIVLDLFVGDRIRVASVDGGIAWARSAREPIDVVLFDKGKEVNPEIALFSLILGWVGASDGAVVPTHRREFFVRGMIVVQSEADLLQIVGALHPVGCFPYLLDGWEEQADQDGDNRDNDQQFDQGKATSALSNAS